MLSGGARAVRIAPRGSTHPPRSPVKSREPYTMTGLRPHTSDRGAKRTGARPKPTTEREMLSWNTTLLTPYSTDRRSARGAWGGRSACQALLTGQTGTHVDGAGKGHGKGRQGQAEKKDRLFPRPLARHWIERVTSTEELVRGGEVGGGNLVNGRGWAGAMDLCWQGRRRDRRRLFLRTVGFSLLGECAHRRPVCLGGKGKGRASGGSEAGRGAADERGGVLSLQYSLCRQGRLTSQEGISLSTHRQRAHRTAMHLSLIYHDCCCPSHARHASHQRKWKAASGAPLCR